MGNAQVSGTFMQVGIGGRAQHKQHLFMVVHAHPSFRGGAAARPEHILLVWPRSVESQIMVSEFPLDQGVILVIDLLRNGLAFGDACADYLVKVEITAYMLLSAPPEPQNWRNLVVKWPMIFRKIVLLSLDKYSPLTVAATCTSGTSISKSLLAQKTIYDPDSPDLLICKAGSVIRLHFNRDIIFSDPAYTDRLPHSFF